jgi:hypothetical protein
MTPEIIMSSTIIPLEQANFEFTACSEIIKINRNQSSGRAYYRRAMESEYPMEIEIIAGPNKDALDWAMTYPEVNRFVSFRSPTALFDAVIEKIDEVELPIVRLTGTIDSGPLTGYTFNGTYQLETHKGLLEASAPTFLSDRLARVSDQLAQFDQRLALLKQTETRHDPGFDHRSPSKQPEHLCS